MFSSDVTEPKQRYEFLAIKREMLLKKKLQHQPGVG